MDRIKEVLRKYTKDDYQLFYDTVDMLCKKGIGKGCFQDYTVLTDVVSILSICEAIIKDETGSNG